MIRTTVLISGVRGNMDRKRKKESSIKRVGHARAIAAGLEASFTKPPPPGALAPAPLFDEIRDLGEEGIEGLLVHLASTSSAGRVPALMSIRELGDKRVLPGLLEHAKALRWSVEELSSLGETIRALSTETLLPADLEADALDRTKKIVIRLKEKEIFSPKAVKEVAEMFLSLSSGLQGVALRAVSPSQQECQQENLPVPENLLKLTRAITTQSFSPHDILIDAVASVGTPEAARVLAEITEIATDKRAGSRIRKALYRLRNSGISVKEGKTKAAVVSSYSPGVAYTAAYMSAVDGRGQMLIWIVRSRHPRGRYLFQAKIRHGRGIEEFVSADATAKEIRELVSGFSSQSSFPVVEISPACGIWFLDRAYKENEISATTVPSAYIRSMMLLKPLADIEKFQDGTHPVQNLLKSPDEKGESRRSGELFSESALWSWVIESKRFEAHFKELLESLQSKIELDEDQRKVRVEQIIEKTSKDLSGDNVLMRRLSLQLEDIALFFHRAGKEVLARECLTLSDQIKDGGKKPSEFFIEMVRYSFGVYLEQIVRQNAPADKSGEQREMNDQFDDEKKSGEGEGPSLIVPP